MGIVHKMTADEAVAKYKELAKVPLPFPFYCSDCGRSNAGCWIEEEAENELHLVCKCGGEPHETSEE